MEPLLGCLSGFTLFLTTDFYCHRNKEEVFSKAMKILLHVCRTPGCVNIIQQDMVVIRRLHNVAVLLERRFEVEKRYFVLIYCQIVSLVFLKI